MGSVRVLCAYFCLECRLKSMAIAYLFSIISYSSTATGRIATHVSNDVLAY